MGRMIDCGAGFGVSGVGFVPNIARVVQHFLCSATNSVVALYNSHFKRPARTQ